LSLIYHATGAGGAENCRRRLAVELLRAGVLLDL
jgi:hypothetical protein